MMDKRILILGSICAILLLIGMSFTSANSVTIESQKVIKDKQPLNTLGTHLRFYRKIYGYLKNVEEMNYRSCNKVGKYYIYKDVEIIGEAERITYRGSFMLWIFGGCVYDHFGWLKLNVKLLICKEVKKLVDGFVGFSYDWGFLIKVQDL
jgi:hypothetical protein